MATWPSTLPGPSSDGYQETSPDNTIRTEMEVGPPKVRKRSTAAPTQYRMNFEMNNTKVNTFLTFYSDTINDGVDSFDMTDPRNGTTETFRIIGPFQISTIGPIYYRITVNMEKLP